MLTLRAILAATIVVVISAITGQLRSSAAPPPATAPATRPAFAPGWDTIDDRLLFLTAQLASVEASIDAVTRQLVITRSGQAKKGAEGEGHRKANEIMDRNMGMPQTIRWEKFYGRTADKFFYHPTDNRSSYHTLTVLGQRKTDNADDKPDANGGVPVNQRPPQFDYLYRANNERRAMAEAEAAKLAGRVDLLASRRRELEAEQAALWCKISSRAVAYRNLLSTRLYRFDVKTPDDAELSKQRLETFRVAVRFLRVANQLMIDADEKADVSTSTYTRTLKATIGKARAELDDQLVKQPLLALDVTDIETWLGKLTAVVRRMDDLSRNVVDSDKLALDGDASGDEQRKHTFRQSLQDQLLILAEGILAGDECVTAMRTEWKLEFDAGAPLATKVEMPKVELAGATTRPAAVAEAAARTSSGVARLPPAPPRSPDEDRKLAAGAFRRITVNLSRDGHVSVSVTPLPKEPRVAIGESVEIPELLNSDSSRDGKVIQIVCDFTTPRAAFDFRPDNPVTMLRQEPDHLTVLLTKRDAFPSFGFPRQFRAPLSVSVDATGNKASQTISWRTANETKVNLDVFVEGDILTIDKSINDDWKGRRGRTVDLRGGSKANIDFSVTEVPPLDQPLRVRWFGQRNQDFKLRSIYLKGELIQ